MSATGEIVALMDATAPGRHVCSTAFSAIRAHVAATSCGKADRFGVSRWIVSSLPGSVSFRSSVRSSRANPSTTIFSLATFGIRLSRAEYAGRVDEMMTRFPRLAQRRTSLGGSLSGGERQMLAIAKVLMRRPKLLVARRAVDRTRTDDRRRARVDRCAVPRRRLTGHDRRAERHVGCADRTPCYLIDGGRIIEEGSPSVTRRVRGPCRARPGSIQA